MQNNIFKAYDIRGVVGTELVLDHVYDLGRAIAAYYKEQFPSLSTVAIGRDGRLHSPVIASELTRAFQDSGISVISVGLCTTPVIYFSEYWLPVQGALMVTASHNPKEYNGIKLCLNKQAVAGSEIQVIKQCYQNKKKSESAVRGSYREYDLVTDYIEFLVRLFPHLVGSQECMIFDCGNGAAGIVLSRLIERMQWQYATALYAEVDGTYPHHTADPTELKNMQDLLNVCQKHSIEYGIGFDGDADRMGVVMASGKLVGGDVLLSGWARSIAQTSAPEDAIFSVAYDIKCSDSLSEILTQHRIIPVPAPSGHSHIKKAMKTTGALLGGELSCHFFFKDRFFGFDDGIYAALRLLELITTYTTPLSAVIEQFPYKERSPEIRIACSLQTADVLAGIQSYFLDKKGATVTTLDGVRVDFSHGWGLMRGSNTQPVLSLRFEAQSIEHIQAIRQEFVVALKSYFPQQFLHDQVTW